MMSINIIHSNKVCIMTDRSIRDAEAYFEDIFMSTKYNKIKCKMSNMKKYTSKVKTTDFSFTLQ